MVGIDTAGALAAPIFELPRAVAGLRRIDPEARRKLVAFLVGQREVMSYTPLTGEGQDPVRASPRGWRG